MEFICKGVFYLDHKDFLEMSGVYKKAPCPVCDSIKLNYDGYTFVNGDMAGKLQMSCEGCHNYFDLYVHSLKSNDVLN